MLERLTRRAAACLLAAAALTGCATGDAAPPCERECLIGALNQYLAAVVANDPSRVPLAPDFRATENAVEVLVGQGMWSTANALGVVQRQYVDPVTGEAGFVGIVEEDAGPAIASLRIKVEDSLVTEAEWIVAREGMAFYNPEGFITNPPPEERAEGVAPPDRVVAITAADSYFEGVDRSDGSLVLAHPECFRIENGTTTVGRKPEWPVRVPDAGPGDGVAGPLSGEPDSSCTSGFENLRNVTEAVIDRRFFADPEAGIAWGSAIFERVPGYTTSRGDVLPWLYFTEIFQIEGGEIRGIYAVMTYLPPEIRSSGWGEISNETPSPSALGSRQGAW